MPASERLVTAFSPFDPDFVNDPYPVYADLREREPVHRSHMGYWVLTRYEDIVAAMKDTRFSNEPSPYAVTNRRNRDKYVAADVANNIIPFMDPPAHTAPRKLIGSTFVNHLKAFPPDIRSICDQLIQPHLERKVIDIVNEFGTPLSVKVIARTLGIPEQDEARLSDWSNWFFYLFSVIPSAEVLANVNRALAEFREYMASLVADRRLLPAQDLISRLAQPVEGRDPLDESQLIDTCMLLFADGVENVDSGIGNCLSTLIRRPAVLERLRADPRLIPFAIDEALRLEPPGQFIAKIAKEDITICGKAVRKNDAVLLVLASANRDEAVFDRPDEFRLDRGNNRHLSLGQGRHSCIGAPLVRMEMETALRAIVDRLENLAFKEAKLAWEARLGHRWLTRLPVMFSARH